MRHKIWLMLLLLIGLTLMAIYRNDHSTLVARGQTIPEPTSTDAPTETATVSSTSTATPTTTPSPTATPMGQSPFPIPTCTPGPQPIHLCPRQQRPLRRPYRRRQRRPPTLLPTVTLTDAPMPPTATETPTATATPTELPTTTETAVPPTATPTVVTILVEGQVLDQATGAGIADVLMTLSGGSELTGLTAPALVGQVYTTTTDLDGVFFSRRLTSAPTLLPASRPAL